MLTMLRYAILRYVMGTTLCYAILTLLYYAIIEIYRQNVMVKTTGR